MAASAGALAATAPAKTAESTPPTAVRLAVRPAPDTSLETYLTNAQATDDAAASSTVIDGVSIELKRSIHYKASEIIQRAGAAINLPQATTATALVLLHQFVARSSFRRFSPLYVCMAALLLASKLTEFALSIHRIIYMIDWLHRFDRARIIEQAHSCKESQNQWDGLDCADSNEFTALAADAALNIEPINPYGNEYYTHRSNMLDMEMEILRNIGFDCRIVLPYNLAINYMQMLGIHTDQQLVQHVWNTINDCFRTEIVTLFQPNDISCAAIEIALGIQPQTGYSSCACEEENGDSKLRAKHAINNNNNDNQRLLPPDWAALFDSSAATCKSIAERLSAFAKFEERRYQSEIKQGLPVPLTLEEIELILKE